jgi:molybdenum cofactor sulfurtransferase
MKMVQKVLVLRRYQWIRQVVFVVLAVTFFALLVTSDSSQSAAGDWVYPGSLAQMRHSDLRHLGTAVYLDYTGAGVYNDAVIDRYRDDLLSRFYPYDHNIASSNSTARQISDEIRLEILDFVGADPSEYSVVFVASATQALKLIGENFPFTNGSTFAYTKWNHNSVLGIRRYALSKNATFQALTWPVSLTEIRSISVPEGSFNLLAFPLEDNFAGTKPSREFLHELTRDSSLRSKWAILGDVAAFLPTNPLNLTEVPLDAVVLSFYKIIGYPNTGALIIRNSFASKLSKQTYASNSVKTSFFNTNEFELHKNLPFRLEDDSVPFQMNLAVRHGLRFLKEIGMSNIQSHVSNLTARLARQLKTLKHSTGLKAIVVYGNHELNQTHLQGGVVAFNVKRTNGSFYGYSNVVSEASLANFHLRGGCHCNPGACFEAMEIEEDAVKKYFDKKTTCGDSLDVIDGVPLGSVRASLGWATTQSDVDLFVNWIRENFVF